MGLDSYDGLKESINNWLNRDDLANSVDDFIDLAEAKHKSDVRIREIVQRAPITVDNRYVTVPDDFAGVFVGGFRLLTDPVTNLGFLNLDKMNEARQETSGKPNFYTIHEQIELDKAPDATYSGELIYYATVDPLDDANPTNAILQRSPDLYLYGALLTTAPFLLNDERVPVWQRLYADALSAANLLARKEMQGGPLTSRPAGATP